MTQPHTSILAFKNEVNRLAIEEDLIFLGIADLDVRDDAERFREWLAENRHGAMKWLTNHLDIRQNPEKILPGAKCALIFAFSYYLGDRWSRKSVEKQPLIAQYARLKDYHSFLKKKVANIQKQLAKLSPDNTAWRITVDSAPVLERTLAFKGGLGFIGKNTCFIHPEEGSFLLLAELFTTWPLGETSQRGNVSKHLARTPGGGCGTCKRCQVNCPTGALDQDYRIDARKCISYWTIEHRDLIPLEYWPWVGLYLFGCDICQLVCPYNRKIKPSSPANTIIRLQSTPNLFDMIHMNQEFYEKVFGGTPMTRAKRSGLRRNAIIAAVVKKENGVEELFKQLEEDPDPVVRGTIEQAKHYIKNRT